MDPNETLRELREALEAGDLEKAREAFLALDAWIARGGFLPDAWHDVITPT